MALSGSHMEPALFYRLIDELKGKNVTLIPFWRGESCLHPDFLTMVDYSIYNNIAIHLSTNGEFMDNDMMDLLYRCEFVTFSLHTGTGFTNAQKLIGEKPSWSTVTIQGSFVDCEKSVSRYLNECISDHNLKGFDAIRLYHEHTKDGRFGQNFGVQTSKRLFCKKLSNTLVIATDGSYSRCNHIWKTENDLNLNDSTIHDVWNGATLNRIRVCYPDANCLSCDQWTGHTNGEVWLKDSKGNIQHKRYGHS